MAVADLVVLQQEFADAGKSAEDSGPAFAKMAKSIYGDAAVDTENGSVKAPSKVPDLGKTTPPAVRLGWQANAAIRGG